jgi:hypothetical protein
MGQLVCLISFLPAVHFLNWLAFFGTVQISIFTLRASFFMPYNFNVFSLKQNATSCSL